MLSNEKKELIERLNLFLKEKTYIYIRNFNGYNFNGYIKEINNQRIILDDDILGQIPILINDIDPKKLTYSTRNKEVHK